MVLLEATFYCYVLFTVLYGGVCCNERTSGMKVSSDSARSLFSRLAWRTESADLEWT